MIADVIKQLKAELLEDYMSQEVTNPEETQLKTLKIRLLDSVTDSLLVFSAKKGEEISYTTMMVQLRTELELACQERDSNPIDENIAFVEILNHYYSKFLELSSSEGA